jgi:hypothetical protein
VQQDHKEPLDLQEQLALQVSMEPLDLQEQLEQVD